MVELSIEYIICPNVTIMHVRRFVDVTGNTYLSRKVLRSLLTSGLWQGEKRALCLSFYTLFDCLNYYAHCIRIHDISVRSCLRVYIRYELNLLEINVLCCGSPGYVIFLTDVLNLVLRSV